ISDASWTELRTILEYKASWYGRELVAIDRFFPSSKLCSACGKLQEKLPLNVREWTSGCGVTHDRDVNAAVNIKAAGLAVSARGADVRTQRATSRTGRTAPMQECHEAPLIVERAPNHREVDPKSPSFRRGRKSTRGGSSRPTRSRDPLRRRALRGRSTGSCPVRSRPRRPPAPGHARRYRKAHRSGSPVRRTQPRSLTNHRRRSSIATTHTTVDHRSAAFVRMWELSPLMGGTYGAHAVGERRKNFRHVPSSVVLKRRLGVGTHRP